jgi:RHS repeat-associated protein
VKTTDARGGVKTVAYDARGLATREVDENGNVRLLDYDELGRLVKETRADGSVYRYAYDALGNPTWIRDARGVETAWTYTAVYKPAAIVKTKDGSADSKTYTWDAAGLVTSASGSGAAYAYNRDTGTGTYRSDPYGRTRAVLAAVGGTDLVARFDYDEAGRTLSAAYPGGAAVSYTYDDRGLLSGVPSWTEPGSHLRNTAGRPLSNTLANGAAASRTWDSDGRLTRIGYTGPSGFVLAGYDITWDRAGNITSKNGNTYRYDELERLSYADEKGTGTASRLIAEASAAEEDHTGQEDLILVAADTEIRVDKASTSVGTTFTGEVSVTKLTLKAPSPGHRVKARNVEAWILKDGSEAWEKVTHAAASVNPEGDVSLSFARSEDAVGVKVHCLYDERDLQDQALDYATFIQRSDSILEVSYHTSRRIETYQYDAKGNRIEVSTTGIGEGSSETTTKGATYWPNTDRIKTYGSWTYVWDAAGNLVEKGTEYAEGVGFSAASGLYVRYEYDLWNRMTAVYKGEAGTASANLAATYAYGPDDIRVSKVSAATGGTAWLHDPAGRVLHEEGPDYARDYVWTEGALLGYEEERDTNGDGTRERFRRYILTDHLGSAIAVLDEARNLLSTTDYSAFGESGDVSPILAPIYTGKQWDADAGLYYFNARWYDPELGRFTTEDPIKDGGNWYAYVGNRPLVATDPTGLAGRDRGASTPTSSQGRPDGRRPVAESAPKVVEEPDSGKPLQPVDDRGQPVTPLGAGLQPLAFSEPIDTGSDELNFLLQGLTGAANTLTFLPGKGLELLGFVESEVLDPATYWAFGMDFADLSLAVGVPTMWGLSPEALMFADSAGRLPGYVLGSLSKAAVKMATPADLARAWQGKGAYTGVDDWVDVILPKGTKVFGGAPGQSGFYTSEAAIQQTGADATRIFQGLQVGKGAYPQYRPGVTAYELTQDLPVGYSRALANPQFGAGGLPQYYIPQTESLKELYSIRLGNR